MEDKAKQLKMKKEEKRSNGYTLQVGKWGKLILSLSWEEKKKMKDKEEEEETLPVGKVRMVSLH